MAFSLASASPHKGTARSIGVRSQAAPSAGSDTNGSPARGALSGTMGASPFVVLATAPELPTSVAATCNAVAHPSRSPTAMGKHGHKGLSLRRANSLNSNALGRTVSGSVTPAIPAAGGSRRVGALRQLGAALALLQLVIVFVLLSRPGWFHRVTDFVHSSPMSFHSPASFLHHGREQRENSGAATTSVVSKLAAGGQKTAAESMHASRRERMWVDAAEAHQQPHTKATSQPETSTQAATATKAVTITLAAQVVKTLGFTDATKSTAASGQTGAKAGIAVAAGATDKSVTAQAASAATVENAAANKKAADATGKKAEAASNAITAVAKPIVSASASVSKDPVKAGTSGTAAADKARPAFPPFGKPVMSYAGRVANPPPIVGVVFYGRRDRVRILDCYLQRNMVHNGGLLTSVVFVTATWQPQDVAFLDRLLALRGSDYRKLYPERLDKGYTGHYAWMDPATTYVKIDDDVVFIADEAIDHMLIAHNLNKYHLISANVVNHQPLELPHSQSHAHFQYEQARPGDKTSWRPVMRPVVAAAAAKTGGGAATGVTQGSAGTATATAMEPVPYIDDGWKVWHEWQRAANVHYSFLANHAAGRLGVYEFPGGEQLWDFNRHFGYTRWRINMIMFKGATIDVHVYNMSSTVATYPGDDEDFITRILPQQLNRTSAAVSQALAVHFSFYMQRAGLENSTDLLDRYALLAERTCGRLVPAE